MPGAADHETESPDHAPDAQDDAVDPVLGVAALEQKNSRRRAEDDKERRDDVEKADRSPLLALGRRRWRRDRSRPWSLRLRLHSVGHRKSAGGTGGRLVGDLAVTLRTVDQCHGSALPICLIGQWEIIPESSSRCAIRQSSSHSLGSHPDHPVILSSCLSPQIGCLWRPTGLNWHQHLMERRRPRRHRSMVSGVRSEDRRIGSERLPATVGISLRRCRSRLRTRGAMAPMHRDSGTVKQRGFRHDNGGECIAALQAAPLRVGLSGRHRKCRRGRWRSINPSLPARAPALHVQE
jgi:hypothetical protein